MHTPTFIGIVHRLGQLLWDGAENAGDTASLTAGATDILRNDVVARYSQMGTGFGRAHNPFFVALAPFFACWRAIVERCESG